MSQVYMLGMCIEIAVLAAAGGSYGSSRALVLHTGLVRNCVLFALEEWAYEPSRGFEPPDSNVLFVVPVRRGANKD